MPRLFIPNDCLNIDAGLGLRVFSDHNENVPCAFGKAHENILARYI